MKRNSLCCSRSARTSASVRGRRRRAARGPWPRASARRAGGAAATAALRRRSPLPSMRAADHDVLQHRGLADHARRLEGAGDAAGGARGRHARRQRVVARSHRARLGGVVAGDDIEGRGLAAAIGADQAVNLAGRDVEIETVDRAHGAETEHDAAQTKSPFARASAQDLGQQGRPRQRWRGCWRAAGGCGSRAGPRCRPA